MTTTTEDQQNRLKEARCRRRLRALGYLLRRSRSRTPEDPTYRSYTIVDEANRVVAGGNPSPVGLTLDEVVAWLGAPREET